MKNKKAWLRIVEAFMAILIVTSVILVMITRAPSTEKSEEVHKMQRAILRQVSLNESLRAEILTAEIGSEPEKTNAFINSTKPGYWDFIVKVCEIEDICGMENYKGEPDKDVFAEEVLISSSIEPLEFAPRKLKFFVWEK